MAKIIKLICIVLCFSFVLIKGFEAYSVSAQTADVRIALLQDADEFSLSVRGRYRIINGKNNAVIFEGRALRKTRVRAVKNGIQIAETVYPYKHLKFLSQNDVTIVINNK